MNSHIIEVSTIKTRMMYKLLLSLLLFTSMLLASVSTIAAEQQPIIGVIDWRAAVFSSKTAKKENEQLKKQHKTDTERLKSLESRIRNNNLKLEKDGETMSSKQKEKILKQLQEDVLAYQKLSEQLRTVLRRSEAEFIESQSPKMSAAFKQISKEKGLHVILAKDAVVYSRLSVDITEDVIKYLDKK